MIELDPDDANFIGSLQDWPFQPDEIAEREAAQPDKNIEKPVARIGEHPIP